MSNTKRAIQNLSLKLHEMTNNDADTYLITILKSYELLITYRANSKKEAFINSIYSASNKNKYSEEIKKHNKQVKSKKSEKYRRALHFEEAIINYRKLSISYQNIAKLLNSHHVHKTQFFNDKYIERFCKEHNIQKGESIGE